MIETKFKQTEFGVIPEGWQESSLSDVLKDFTTGATPYRGIKDFYSGFIPWVSSGELNYNLIKDTNEHITEVARQKTNLKLYPAGTFLMAITGLEAEGTRGKCAILGTSATTNQSCLALSSTDKMIVDYWFYFYQFWSDWYAFRFSQGTKQQSYKADIVRKFPVIFPSDIKEQQRIAEALSNIDNLISSLSKIIEKKRLIKQGAMQQLLTGKKRLPGFDGEWEEDTLGNICLIIMGQSPSSTFYNTKSIGLPLIQGNADMKNRKSIIRFYTSRITKTCNANDIIMTVRAPVGSVGKASYESCIGRGVCAIRTSNDFLYHYLIYIEDSWQEFSKGSTFDSINSKELSECSVFLPKDEGEQFAIANILTSMDNEIESLEEERDKYIQLKEGMMQKLLTGHIRLVNKA